MRITSLVQLSLVTQGRPKSVYTQSWTWNLDPCPIWRWKKNNVIISVLLSLWCEHYTQCKSVDISFWCSKTEHNDLHITISNEPLLFKLSHISGHLKLIFKVNLYNHTWSTSDVSERSERAQWYKTDSVWCSLDRPEINVSLLLLLHLSQISLLSVRSMRKELIFGSHIRIWYSLIPYQRPHVSQTLVFLLLNFTIQLVFPWTNIYMMSYQKKT